MNSLLLDQTRWDLCVDAAGDIALAGDPYATAQDVATAVKLFLGELWFDTSKGVPYWAEILGRAPSLGYIRAQIEAAALGVPRVTQARCIIASFVGRKVVGTVEVINTDGQALNVTF